MKPRLSVLLSGLGLSVALAAGAAEPPSALKFHADGSFKILQLTDLHYRAVEGPAYAEKYSRTVGALLDAEQPDLVMITGDLVSWSGRSVREQYEPALAPVIGRKIPWAVTLGNHDTETRFTGEDVMVCLRDLPYSRCQPGPASLGGGGNYTIEIGGAQTGRPAWVLYALDSHDRAERRVDYAGNIAVQLGDTHARPRFQELERKHGQEAREIHDRIAKFNRSEMAAALAGSLDITTASGKTVSVTRADFYPMENSSYDWIHLDQINWYNERSLPYTGGNSNRPPPALLFLHIPLPEYAEAWSTGKARGSRLEPECAPKFNSGLFTALVERGDVRGVFCGHDHFSDYVAFKEGVALAYGRKTGLDGSGSERLAQGARVIVLHENQRQFDTWIRTADGKIENQIRVPDSF